MYGRYPVNIPPAVVRTENRYIVYIILAIYTISVAAIGYLVGEQAFDPVEQAKFEERHWKYQATNWKLKVDEWKSNYNIQSNTRPGDPVPCPVCNQCPIPTICIGEPGIVCAADPCMQGVKATTATHNQPNDQEVKMISSVMAGLPMVASTANLSQEEPAPVVGIVGDKGSGVVPEVHPPLDNIYPSQGEDKDVIGGGEEKKKGKRKGVERRFPSLFDVASTSIDLLAGVKAPPLESQVSYVESNQVVAGGMTGGEQDPVCPACYICPSTEKDSPAPLVDVNHVECDKEAILMKMDEAEKAYRGMESTHRGVDPNSKFARKIKQAQATYQEMQRCLELAMPAVFEAYQETVKARFG